MYFTSVRRVLSGLQATDVWQEIREWKVLLEIWPRVVGKTVAAKTRPLHVRGGILTVAVPNASWAQNLTFQRRRIVSKLQKQVRLSIRDVRFSSRDWYDDRQSWRPADSATSIFQAHPSWVGGGKNYQNVPTSDRTSEAAPPPTQNSSDAVLAFQNWSKTIRDRTQSWSVCPQCGCPVPAGELQRWSVCSICACRQFEQNLMASREENAAEESPQADSQN
ncbi:DUF721 domain-containing protein [Geitlerinema sp. PCC 9228]|jgi:predicted nucleic acid-binding Zn ribbon protein|uniref:DUF721 domain-containing protein n=1 Tax=Geitlerinema sp. PCC 9228 TaxID=111611 RepID=UPI0008F9E423|nr:DUF721 domain-containing protein [Geitlerinema sp. PCC 9228]